MKKVTDRLIVDMDDEDAYILAGKADAQVYYIDKGSDYVYEWDRSCDIDEIQKAEEIFCVLTEKKNDTDIVRNQSDKLIYKSCVNMMKSLTKCFFYYLKMIEVDFKKLDEDNELFGVFVTNSEIVKTLFLGKTKHSKKEIYAKCKELCIDPAYMVAFDFEEYLNEEDEE